MSNSSAIVALASDHAGVELKSVLAAELKAAGLEPLDLGTNSTASVDYPDFAAALAKAIRDKKADRGILICGSGIGIAISANRFPWIRAALVHDALTTRLSRQHNDANVLVLGARVIGVDTAKDCLQIFLNTRFEGGRHAGRVAKMDALAP